MSLVDWNLIRRFGDIAAADSIMSAARHILEVLRVTVVVRGSFVQKGPVLYISNHKSGLDGMFLLSVIARDDLHMVGLASYELLGVKFAQKLLPMYRFRKKRDYFLDIVAGGADHHILSDISLVRRKNQDSIARGAEIVTKGGVVVIFPTGSAGRRPSQGIWKAGVGFLAKQIKNPKTQVIFVAIEGGSRRDMGRFMHPLLRTIFYRSKTVVLTFAKPVLLSKIITKEKDGKDSVWELEREYRAIFKQT